MGEKGAVLQPTVNHVTAIKARPGKTREFCISRPLRKSLSYEIRASEEFATCFLTMSPLQDLVLSIRDFHVTELSVLPTN